MSSNRNIVIKEADKGSGVAVWDREDYISEANRQLEDRQVYEEIEVDPTVNLGKTINSRLNELREEDPGLEEVTDYLPVKDSRLGRFYLLPKIHKGLSSVKGRPVISNCGTVTEHISEYLDHHLNALVSQSRSYVKDTNHILSTILVKILGTSHKIAPLQSLIACPPLPAFQCCLNQTPFDHLNIELGGKGDEKFLNVSLCADILENIMKTGKFACVPAYFDQDGG